MPRTEDTDTLTAEQTEELHQCAYQLSVISSTLGSMSYASGMSQRTYDKLHRLQVTLVGVSAAVTRIEILADLADPRVDLTTD